MNAEAAGPNVTGVATVTAVTKQPKTLHTNRTDIEGTDPAAIATNAAEARESVGSRVTALTPVTAGRAATEQPPAVAALAAYATDPAAPAEDGSTQRRPGRSIPAVATGPAVAD